MTDPLLNADIDSSAAALAPTANAFVSALLTAYGNAQLGAKLPFQQLPVIVLSIPRPNTAPSDPDARKIDKNRAEIIWNAIDNKQVGQFTVKPEDVYSLSLGQGVISCFEATPVVKTVGIYVVRPGAGDTSALNALNRRFQAYGSTTQPYQTTQGLRTYQLGDGPRQRFETLWRYGDDGRGALTDFATAPRTVRPVGLSPFGTFDLDFRVLDQLHNTGFESTNAAPATEIVLMLEVDSRAVGSVVSGVRRCQAP